MFTFEPSSVLGRQQLLFLYFYSGICGSALSCLGNPQGLSVGASSCLFGLLALESALVFVRWEHIDKSFRGKLLSNLLLMLFINFGIGVIFSQILDNYAHLGGFLGGLACSFYFIALDREYERQWRRYRLASLVAMATLLPTLVALIFVVPLDEEHQADFCSGET